MNIQELLENYKPLLKKHWLPLLLGFLGLIFFVYGLIGLFGPSPAKPDQDEIVFNSSEESAEAGENKFSQITVDIEGEVIKPGVYNLSSNSRIQDALVASGGLSEEADRDWVERNLNLALKVKDGMKIYIPDKSQNSNVKSQNYDRGTSVKSNLVNINSANMGELDSLPGVGQVTAQKIIENRPYSGVEELLEKKVISNSVFEKIKEKISLY